MRRNRERRFLQGDDSAQIENAAVNLLYIVAADWKPERHCLTGIANVDRNKSVRRAVVTGEQQHAFGKIAAPVVEEIVDPPAKLGTASPDAQKLAYQLHQPLA